MKKVLFILAAVLIIFPLVLTSCQAAGPMTTKDYAFTDFTGVQAGAISGPAASAAPIASRTIIRIVVSFVRFTAINDRRRLAGLQWPNCTGPLRSRANAPASRCIRAA